METTNEKFELRPLTKKDLRNLYGISVRVLNNMLKSLEPELGKPTGLFYNLKQVELILKKLGIPKSINVE